MSLYLWINVAILIVPFAFSFDRKVRFYRHWPSVFLAIVVVGTAFEQNTLRTVADPRRSVGSDSLQSWLSSPFYPRKTRGRCRSGTDSLLHRSHIAAAIFPGWLPASAVDCISFLK